MAVDQKQKFISVSHQTRKRTFRTQLCTRFVPPS